MDKNKVARRFFIGPGRTFLAKLWRTHF